MTDRHNRLRISRVLGRTFALWFRNLPMFVGLSLLVQLPLIFFLLSELPLGPPETAVAVRAVAISAFTILAEATIAYVLLSQLRGDSSGLVETLLIVIDRAPTLAILGAGLGLAPMLAIRPELTILLIPVYLFLYVIAPVVIAERSGLIQALKRSASLIRPNWARALAVFFVVGTLGWILPIVVVRVAYGKPVPPDQLAMLLPLASIVLAGPLLAVAKTITYSELTLAERATRAG